LSAVDCNSNTLIPGEIGQVYTATADGDYVVIVTENGCVDTSSCINIGGVGINNLTAIPS